MNRFDALAPKILETWTSLSSLKKIHNYTDTPDMQSKIVHEKSLLDRSGVVMRQIETQKSARLTFPIGLLATLSLSGCFLASTGVTDAGARSVVENPRRNTNDFTNRALFLWGLNEQSVGKTNEPLYCAYEAKVYDVVERLNANDILDRALEEATLDREGRETAELRAVNIQGSKGQKLEAHLAFTRTQLEEAFDEAYIDAGFELAGFVVGKLASVTLGPASRALSGIINRNREISGQEAPSDTSSETFAQIPDEGSDKASTGASASSGTQSTPLERENSVAELTSQRKKLAIVEVTELDLCRVHSGLYNARKAAEKELAIDKTSSRITQESQADGATIDALIYAIHSITATGDQRLRKECPDPQTLRTRRARCN